MTEAHETGRRGEALAVELARERGWQPWLSNVPVGGGEADLVCFRERNGRRQGLLVEVKASRNPRADLAARLSKAQQRRLWHMAETLCVQHDLESIEVVILLVTLLPGAERVAWVELEPF